MAQAIIKEANVARKKRNELMKIIAEQEKQIQELKDENETTKKKLQVKEESNKFIDREWKSDRDLLQTNLARLEITEKQGTQLKAKYDGEVLKSQTQKKQIYDLQRERAELLNRLSKLAGDRLKHENTNIADLSDADRPTKLSDTYSELYDNEWTDAFEELTDRGLTANDAVGKLLEILLVSFHKCREITWERYRTLKSIVSTIDIVHILPYVEEVSEIEVQGNTGTLPLGNGNTSEAQASGKGNVNNPDVCTNNASTESEIVHSRNEEVGRPVQSKEKHHTSTTTLSTDQEKQIKDIWRTTTIALKNEAVKHLYIVLLTSFDIPIKDMPNTLKYLTSCIDLCWKMGIQEKPMHLDVIAEKNDGSEKTFDLDKFKAYTKTGEKVAFVVWPALFLHEGGPMLVKGIAQGCKKSEK